MEGRCFLESGKNDENIFLKRKECEQSLESDHKSVEKSQRSKKIDKARKDKITSNK